MYNYTNLFFIERYFTESRVVGQIKLQVETSFIMLLFLGPEIRRVNPKGQILISDSSLN